MPKKKKKGPGEQFADEIVSICMRWWEESDLDEEQMMKFGVTALEAFCDAQVVFDSDIDLSEDEEEKKEEKS